MRWVLGDRWRSDPSAGASGVRSGRLGQRDPASTCVRVAAGVGPRRRNLGEMRRCGIELRRSLRVATTSIRAGAEEAREATAGSTRSEGISSIGGSEQRRARARALGRVSEVEVQAKQRWCAEQRSSGTVTAGWLRNSGSHVGRRFNSSSDIMLE